MNSAFDIAVDHIYQSAAEPECWPLALQAVADCSSDVGTVLIFGKDDGTFGAICSESLRGVTEEHARDWSDRDLRAIRCHERGYFFNRDVMSDSEFMSPEEMETEPYYAVLLKKYGLKYCAGAMVSPSPHVEVALSVQRSLHKPDFTEQELTTLAALGRHVERSLRLSLRLMDAEAVSLGLSEALTRMGMGVFVLDALNRVVFSNPAAQALLGDGIEMIGDALHVDRQPMRVNVKETSGTGVVHSQAGPAWEKPILVHRRSTSRPLVLHILPIPNSGTAVNHFLTEARVIVLVIDTAEELTLEPAFVRDFFGLTLGEARVAAKVGAGITPRIAAGELGIAEETARSVLKRVCAKLGVSRQSELAVLMTRLHMADARTKAL
jgi:DNA-binding CsgD family transcriptional regulator/PAS domain-containing protein